MSHQRLAFHGCSYTLNSIFENPSTLVIDRFNGLENADAYHYYILGSCNGFLCLYDPYPDQNKMIMYNPSIGLKSKSSPKIKPSVEWGMLYNGFGYDHVNDKYKVLAVVEHDDGDSDAEDFGQSLTKVYTFGEDSCRTIQDLPYTGPNEKYGKYVSGTLNWVCRCTWSYPMRYVIVSFDLDKETYRDVLLPQNVHDGFDYTCIPSLCVLNDCLCLCYVDKTHLVVWSMKEYGVVESWTELMSIPREKLIFLNSMVRYSITELLFVSEDGVVLLLASSQLFLYNLNTGVLDHPFISIGGVYDPQIYRENLISPQW
jgi:F-box interacting protein